ncbi:hypothetical protein Dsin_022428 [Dipteronia sinensis]|uniref:Endonuclease/exonuclease/phosphatase domain-containing protein n=1 Tax=Dipteronia sinensis TaxID=43782 RepID=A0AAE0DZS5_9ROSI|nr:hypothetical protein Dsin_022428 [Dipteronia sinensis]
MNCIAWNARGLGNPRAFRALSNLKKSFNPDILFLSKTKATQLLLELYRVRLGFSGKLVVEKVGKSGGLCLFWSNKVNVNSMSFSRFHIDVGVVSNNTKVWRLTGFYGNPEPDQLHHVWTLLRRLNGLSKLPWLCFGDFNEILSESEKVGDAAHPRILVENFREALDFCELEDMDFVGPCVTWSNKRDEGFIQERLNRGVCDFKWKQLFPSSSVENLDFWYSDHRAILVKVVDEDGLHRNGVWRHKRRFHFEACWADDSECRKLVSDNWGENIRRNMVNVDFRLLQCAMKLAIWNQSNRQALRWDIDNKKKEIYAASKNIKQGSWKEIRRMNVSWISCLKKRNVTGSKGLDKTGLKAGIVTRNSFIGKRRLGKLGMR